MPGFFAHGATMTIERPSAGSPVAIDGLLDIPLPDREREDVEITDQNSAFEREYVPGLRDNGALDMTMRMVPSDTGQAALQANHEADGEIAEFVITAPSHISPRPRWTFDGYVRTRGGTLYWENTAAERTVSVRVTSSVTEVEIT